MFVYLLILSFVFSPSALFSEIPSENWWIVPVNVKMREYCMNMEHLEKKGEWLKMGHAISSILSQHAIWGYCPARGIVSSHRFAQEMLARVPAENAREIKEDLARDAQLLLAQTRVSANEEELLHDLIRRYPKTPASLQAVQQLARKYLDSQEVAAAVEYSRKAVDQQPEEKGLALRLAWALSLAGKKEEAKKILEGIQGEVTLGGKSIKVKDFSLPEQDKGLSTIPEAFFWEKIMDTLDLPLEKQKQKLQELLREISHEDLVRLRDSIVKAGRPQDADRLAWLEGLLKFPRSPTPNLPNEKNFACFPVDGTALAIHSITGSDNFLVRTDRKIQLLGPKGELKSIDAKEFTQVAFRPDGLRFVAASKKGIEEFDSQTLAPLKVLYASPIKSTALAYSRDEKLLLIGEEPPGILALDAWSGVQKAKFPILHLIEPGKVRAMDFDEPTSTIDVLTVGKTRGLVKMRFPEGDSAGYSIGGDASFENSEYKVSASGRWNVERNGDKLQIRAGYNTNKLDFAFEADSHLSGVEFLPQELSLATITDKGKLYVWGLSKESIDAYERSFIQTPSKSLSPLLISQLSDGPLTCLAFSDSHLFIGAPGKMCRIPLYYGGSSLSRLFHRNPSSTPLAKPHSKSAKQHETH